MMNGSHDTLTILAVTDRYPVGQVEEDIFQNALHQRSFKLLSYPIPASTPLTTIPDEVCAQVDGLFILRHYVSKEDISRFPKLRCIVRTGVGYDNFDRKALAAAGITLHNVPDYGTTEVADHAMALALSFRRGILLQHDAQRVETPRWGQIDWPSITSSEERLIQRPKGRIFCIIGLGRIGTAVARRAQAFGWTVAFYDPWLPNGVELAYDLVRFRTVEQAFSQSDVISLHCQLTPETNQIVNDHTLSLVKPGCVLINVARGEMVNLDALERALRSGELAAAGLDVLENEPPKSPVHPLIKAYRDKEASLQGRLVITPHVAFYSKESVEDTRRKSAETMRDVLFDGLNTNLIPLEAM